MINLESISKEVDRRAKLYTYIENNPSTVSEVLKISAKDPVWWINNFGWTYDPRNQDIPKRLPFNLFPRQVELVQWVMGCFKGNQQGLLKKSRDIGATYLMAAIAVHMWLFIPEVAVAFGSRKQELVDRLDDPKTVFYKIRDILYLLPSWMRPSGFSRDKNDNFCKIINPDNGATITGEAGDQMGRGGRSSIYFADEFAFMPRAKSVRAALSANTNCTILLSTSNGIGTEFYNIEQERAAELFYYLYHDDPRKTPEWAEKKRKEIGSTSFAQEYECDDAASLDQVIIPARWVHSAVSLELSDSGVLVAGLDVADLGSDRTVFTLRRGPVLTQIKQMDQQLPGDQGREAIRLALAAGCTEFVYDRDGVGTSIATAVSQVNPQLNVTAVRNGGRPTDIVYEDDDRLSARERFANYGTEIWWSLRRRFEKTYEHVNGVREYDPSELISIPSNGKLIAELSCRQYEVTEGGKIRLESKRKLKARGIKSPDLADSLAYCFAPIPVRNQTLGVHDISNRTPSRHTTIPNRNRGVSLG